MSPKPLEDVDLNAIRLSLQELTDKLGELRGHL
jgi:hypothetical protein